MAEERNYSSSNTPVGIGGAGLTPSAPYSSSSSSLPLPASTTLDSLPYTNDVCVTQVTNPLLTAGSRLLSGSPLSTSRTTNSTVTTTACFTAQKPSHVSTILNHKNFRNIDSNSQNSVDLSPASNKCDVDQMNDKNMLNSSELLRVLPPGDFSSLSVLQRIQKIESGKLEDSDDSLSSNEDISYRTAIDTKSSDDDLSKDYLDETLTATRSSISSDTSSDSKSLVSACDFSLSSFCRQSSIAAEACASPVACPSSASEVPCFSANKTSCRTSVHNNLVTGSCVSEQSHTPGCSQICDNLSMSSSTSSCHGTAFNSESESLDGLRSVTWPPELEKPKSTSRELSVFKSLPVYPIVGPLLSTDLHISDSSIIDKSKKSSTTARFSDFLNNTKNSLSGDSSSKGVELLSYRSTPSLTYHSCEPRLSGFPRSTSGFLTPTIIENFSTDSLTSTSREQPRVYSSVVPGNKSTTTTSATNSFASVSPLVNGALASPSPSSTFPSRSRAANTTVLHHIIPQRFYPSPRPLRRGTSIESLSLSPPNIITTSSFVSDTLKPCSALTVSPCPSATSHLHCGVSGATYTSQPNLFTSAHTLSALSTRARQDRGSLDDNLAALVSISLVLADLIAWPRRFTALLYYSLVIACTFVLIFICHHIWEDWRCFP